MIQRVKNYITTNNLLSLDSPVIVGFSGGSDSVTLLYILNSLGYDCIAAHCNFHLRGDESNHDETFCFNFTKQNNIKYIKTDFDTLSHAANNHLSVEMAARELRHQWFESLRIQYNAQAIATGHHINDSAETILINIIRGTGIHGLCGIRPKNKMTVHPLLCLNKEDILSFTKNNNLSYIIDSSNLSCEFIRNYLRIKVFPMLEHINPAIIRNLIKLSEHISETERLLDNVINDAKSKIIQNHPNKNYITLSIQELLNYSSPKTVLYEIIKEYGFSRVDSESLFHSLNKQSGKIFYATSSDYYAIKDRKHIIIKQFEIDESAYIINSINEIPDNLPFSISFHQFPMHPSYEIDKNPYVATFDYDKIHFPLIIRKWAKGDYFIPYGMKGRKKISDFFIDRKLSLADKKKAWLLCCEQDVIWIIGLRSDERYKVDKTTKNVLVVNFF